MHNANERIQMYEKCPASPHIHFRGWVMIFFLQIPIVRSPPCPNKNVRHDHGTIGSNCLYLHTVQMNIHKTFGCVSGMGSCHNTLVTSCSHLWRPSIFWGLIQPASIGYFLYFCSWRDLFHVRTWVFDSMTKQSGTNKLIVQCPTCFC